MLRFLEAREHGVDSPEMLIKAEASRRAFSIELSKYFDVQKIFDSGINTLDIDPTENRYLLSGSADGVIVIYDLHNLRGEPKCTFPMVCTAGKSNRYRHKHSIETVTWFPIDTGMFLSSGTDKLLKVWDTNALKTADEFEFSHIVYSHDMSQVAKQHNLVAVACQSAKVRLIDLKTGSATHTLRGHREAVYCCKWSTKQEYIVASGSADSKVMIWDIRSAKGCLHMLDQYNGDSKAVQNSVKTAPEGHVTAHEGHVNGLNFTADGLHLVTCGTDHHMRVWNTMSGANTNVSFGKIPNDSHKCVKLAVSSGTSPDLVYVPSEANILVYDISSGQKVSTLRGHYNQVNCCLFHADNQELYSCGNDRNILVWTPKTDTVIAYEEHLAEQAKEPKPDRTSGYTRRIGTADAWSSDED